MKLPIQAKMSFFKNKEQEGKTGPVWGLVPVGGGGHSIRYRKTNVVKILCTHEGKWKMRPFETIPEMGEGR
jgi:hypothetical protein